jgi:GxxExxY protein
MIEFEITQQIIGCAYTVHNTLGTGFLEKVYENVLRIELKNQGLQVKQQEPVQVYYKGQVVGDYCIDSWVEEKVLVEIKALKNLCREHEVQLVNYLSATGINVGLLINFGSPSVQIKRRLRELPKSIPAVK